MAPGFDPLGLATLPPKLALRALDDFHTMATATGEVVALLRSLEATARDVQEKLDRAIAVAEAIEMRGEQAVERIDAVLHMGDRLDVVAHTAIDEARAMEATAREVASIGAQVASALPMVERALELTEPLEGAVERLGRIVDRLPGGKVVPRPPRGRAAKSEG